MALTITDNRTRPTEADATTGWTASGGVAVFTSAPDPVELTGCLGQQVSNSTETAYYSITAADLSNTLVYCWLLPGGVLDSTTNGGVQIYLGDGTDNIGFHVGGSDGAGFRHDEGPVVWQCFAIDTSQLAPLANTAFNGSPGSLTLTSITRVGNAFKTLAKSVGGVENCFMDIISYGNDGLTLTAGTVGSPGTWLDVATADRSEATLTAYGICRELAADTFGLQGPITIGDSAGTATTYFAETNTSAIFEDRGFATNKYRIEIVGNSTGTTTFQLGTRAGEGIGGAGCALTCPTGVGAAFIASDANVDFCNIYASTVSGFDQGITFSNASNGPNHEIFASSFVGCGKIRIGTTEFKNNTIQASTADGTTGKEAAVEIEDTSNVSDLSFVSAGTGHAIYIGDNTNSPFDFTNFTYDGYGADGTTNAVIWNNSGGNVTINVSGGDTPTVLNGTGANTIINNTVTVTLTGMKNNTEVRVYAAGTTSPEIAGIENATGGTSDNRSFGFNTSAGSNLDIRVFNIQYEPADILSYIVPSVNTSLPIQQRFDRNYENL